MNVPLERSSRYLNMPLDLAARGLLLTEMMHLHQGMVWRAP
jgi:hypothetical protein